MDWDEGERMSIRHYMPLGRGGGGEEEHDVWRIPSYHCVLDGQALGLVSIRWYDSASSRSIGQQSVYPEMWSGIDYKIISELENWFENWLRIWSSTKINTKKCEADPCEKFSALWEPRGWQIVYKKWDFLNLTVLRGNWSSSKSFTRLEQNIIKCRFDINKNCNSWRTQGKAFINCC